VYDPEKLVATALGVAVVVLVLAIFAILGQEERSPHSENATKEARKTNFSGAFRSIILVDTQARLFFGIVVMTFVGTLAQDVLLEPFGGLVMKMEVGETTGLTQYWGIGVLLAMVLSGVILLKLLGFMKVMRAGMLLSMLSFVGPIAAGVSGNVGLLKASVMVMGFGTGLAGAGMLSGTLAFTSKIRAGMLLGVWGVANMVGHAIGSLLGGVIVDGVRVLTGNAFSAYTAVFVFEIVVLAIALLFTFQLKFNSSAVYCEEKQASAFA
jgi:BCD family chlorophyll transporter-like MFS transporter